jgi:cation diffusion facilitator family transporter
LADTQTSEKHHAATTSVFASAGLLLLKMIAAFVTGSLGLLGEVIHSVIDLGATIVTWFAVKAGDRPADEDHHFGHSKIESVAALAETVLLLVTAIGLALAAVQRLWGGTHEVTFHWIAVVLVLITIAVDFNRSRMLKKTADKTASEALAADALHFHMDMWSSLAVLIGLGGVALGFAWLDSLAALAVAAFIAVSGIQLGARTIATLVDQAPAGISETVRTIADDQPGVLAVSRVRARPSGAGIFIELTLQISRMMPLTTLTAMKQVIADRVGVAIANADLTITTEPIELDTETVVDKVALLARHDNLAIHHVLVQNLAGKLSVSYDLEVDGKMSLAEAHETATRLEGNVRTALGDDVEVETHIEPLPPDIIIGRDAEPSELKYIQNQLFNLANAGLLVEDVHNVRLRKAASGDFVHYHCRFPPETRVTDAHAAIDYLEDQLKAANPQILRVVAHAEPRKDAP